MCKLVFLCMKNLYAPEGQIFMRHFGKALNLNGWSVNTNYIAVLDEKVVELPGRGRSKAAGCIYVRIGSRKNKSIA